jgi:hypothetical protein
MLFLQVNDEAVRIWLVMLGLRLVTALIYTDYRTDWREDLQCWLLTVTWARIFKLLRSPRIDSKEPILPGCVAWARIFKLLRTPGIDSKKSIPPCSLCSQAGRYDEPIPTRFLAPHRLFKNSSSGGPVRQPFSSSSVPSPYWMYKNSSTGQGRQLIPWGRCPQKFLVN